MHYAAVVSHYEALADAAWFPSCQWTFGDGLSVTLPGGKVRHIV